MGNQLFQYALGRKLALDRKDGLLLDISEFKTYPHHKYSLQNFNIEQNYATRLQVGKLRLINKLRSSKPYYKKLVFKEAGHPFDPHISEAAKNVYLDGYWQTERYFRDVREVILKDLTLIDPQDKEYLEMLNKIKGVNSIALHVRRTNYLVGKNAGLFNICPPDYYKSALDIMAQKINMPELFIFSDDTEWAKKNISFNYPITVVSDMGFRDYQELALMRACKNHITANSTFSWWGAWLGDYPQKIVITPKKWFINPAMDERDIAPQEWIKI